MEMRKVSEMEILMIDNYDSFTYNLVQYLSELGADVDVHRNDKISIEEIRRMNPDKIVISPGPCTPKQAGISVKVVKEFSGKIPILGVCLGHQCIAAAFGGRIVKAKKLMHGKTSQIIFAKDLTKLFDEVPLNFIAMRYHSLVVREDVPSNLVITARSTDDDEIMGIKHKDHKTEGIQFHPESIFTEHGKKILKNFLNG